MTQAPETATAMSDILMEPKDCALILVDQQAGLALRREVENRRHGRRG